MGAESVFSTRELPAREQFGYWREWVCGSITQLTADRDSRGPFAGDIRLRTLDDIRIVAARADPHRRMRTPADIARRSEDAFFVYLPLAGALRVEPIRGEPFVVPVGTPCLLNPSLPAALVLREAHAHIALNIPRRRVAPLLGDPGGHFDHRPLSGGGLGPLLASYMGGLCGGATVTADMESAVAANFYSLLALALGASETGRERSRGSVAAARLQAMFRWLDRNFADPGLTPATAATYLGVSERYLHKLFEPTGSSFTQNLNRRRLDASHAALENPALNRRTITDISLSCGFGDISHFNRSFKATYGKTPREVRLAYRFRQGGPSTAEMQS